MLSAQLAYRLGAAEWTSTLIVGSVAAALMGLAWSRVTSVQTFLTILSPAALVVPGRLPDCECIRLTGTGTKQGSRNRASACPCRGPRIRRVVAGFLDGQQRPHQRGALSTSCRARGRWRLVSKRHCRERLHAMGTARDSDGPLSHREKRADSAVPPRYIVLAARAHASPQGVPRQ